MNINNSQEHDHDLIMAFRFGDENRLTAIELLAIIAARKTANKLGSIVFLSEVDGPLPLGANSGPNFCKKTGRKKRTRNGD